MSNNQKVDSSVHVMPLVAENYSVTKKSIKSDVVIEKRWVEKVETIRVPVRYEELYVNGKPLKSGSTDALVSALKNTVGSKGSGTKKAQTIPIFDGDGVSEKIIPLYGEKVTVAKKIAHTGDIAIRKQRVMQVKRLRVSTISEVAKAKYPSGRVEKLA